ncbi:hypothetical protein KXX11_003688, partial [Aspergillus fumigatus]
RGAYTSWIQTTATLGLFLSLLVILGVREGLGEAVFNDWGWRIPFFFGLLIGPAGLYIRRHLDEGMEFKRAAQEATPVRTTLVDQRGRTLAAMGLIILATIVAYTGLFMPTFAVRQLGLPPSMAFAGTFWFGLLQFALVPVFGSLSDRVGRLAIMRSAALVMLVMIVPLFYLLGNHPSVPALMVALTAMGVVASAYWGPISAA